MELKTYSAEETMSLGFSIGRQLLPGDVICLLGGLGAGKTTLTQGLARGLGVKRTISSPTFPIICEYEGRLPFYHMDVYRLGEGAWREALGFDEYLYGDGVCVIEWAEWLRPLLPEERLDIVLTRETEQTRVIELIPKGRHFEDVVEECAGGK